MKSTFEAENIVRGYTAMDRLQKPEQTILGLLRERLGYMKMLDIGVGGGRTTVHFAPLVRQYVGVDYAANMVKACEERFPDREDHISFGEADARYMNQFPAGSFDFILFSYNGIDNISHEDRLLALKEINRVGKSGGVFAFSTHNLRSLHKVYKIKFYKNPKKLAYQILSYFLLIWLNGFPGKHQRKPYTIVNDGTHRFGLKMYYIQPEYQIKQLEASGFCNIRLFSVSTGQEIDPAKLDQVVDDGWIYYLCEIE